MSDLIERQAAIDALCKAGCDSGYCGISCDDVKAIENLPSAQPECKQECMPMYANVSDTISRQAAINAPVRMVSEGIEWIPVYHVEELPPAQPQRMKGRWLRKESDLSWWYECSKCGESPLHDPYDNEVLTPFCPWCGADMRGEDK